MTRLRRVRCKGPLCAPKKPHLALHHRAETVKLPDGRRLCLECAREVARPAQPEPTLVSLEEELAASLAERGGGLLSEMPVASGGAPVTIEALMQAGEAIMGQSKDFYPAPTVQVDLGDPLAWEPMPDVRVEDWPLRKGRLSAGSLGLFLSCPEAFRRKLILGEREPGSGRMILGGAAHKAVEANYRHMMAVGAPAPPKVWREWYDARFDKERDEFGASVDWGNQGWGDKHRFSDDEARQRGADAAGVYIARLAPLVEPIGVEEPFVTWLSGVPVPLVGVKDVVTADRVIDVKFGSVSRSVKPGWMLQGLLYQITDPEKAMAWHSVGWPKADGTSTYYAPEAGADLLIPSSYERYTIATDAVRTAVSAIMAYAREFGRDRPWPGSLTGVGHSGPCEFCFFKTNGCPWWSRPISGEDLF